jgi:hypothetical protein
VKLADLHGHLMSQFGNGSLPPAALQGQHKGYFEVVALCQMAAAKRAGIPVPMAGGPSDKPVVMMAECYRGIVRDGFKLATAHDWFADFSVGVSAGEFRQPFPTMAYECDECIVVVATTEPGLMIGQFLDAGARINVRPFFVRCDVDLDTMLDGLESQGLDTSLRCALVAGRHLHDRRWIERKADPAGHQAQGREGISSAPPAPATGSGLTLLDLPPEQMIALRAEVRANAKPSKSTGKMKRPHDRASHTRTYHRGTPAELTVDVRAAKINGGSPPGQSVRYLM